MFGKKLMGAVVGAFAILGATAGTAAGAPHAAAVPVQAGHGAVESGWLVAKARTLAEPELMPLGVNDYGCRSAEHPRPVVLVHGTFSNAYDSFSALAPYLKDRGFCVFAFNFGASDALIGKVPGVNGTARVEKSIGELSAFVDDVLARTGVAQVDLFGWSQGGVLSHGYAKFGGGASADAPATNKVATIVTYGSPNGGTTSNGILSLIESMGQYGSSTDDLGPVLEDFGPDSDYVARLNDGGITMPGVRYTSIASRYDELVTPYRTGFIDYGAERENVENITLQDGCEVDLSDHLQGMYSPRMMSLTARALGDDTPIACRPNAPLL